jgi:site-specific DNA-cytosine methylase
MTIRISTTSKLDGIRSWSLEALTTCPGSRTAGGDQVRMVGNSVPPGMAEAFVKANVPLWALEAELEAVA